MARPRKDIDFVEFEKLCAIQCTKVEICDWFDISDKTLDKLIKEYYGEDASFSDIYRQKRVKGKVSLRRSQFQMAEKNVAMAIWLGKQYLDQSDKQETKHSQDGSFSFEIVKVDEEKN